jgi:hypothetical protein
VPVTKKLPVFLRTAVNDPRECAQECLDIVRKFIIPRQTRALPLNVVLCIITSQLIPKLEARIALQPLRPADAAKLDTKITQKVIKYLNMTFSMKPYYLNQLLKHHGRGLPSIQDINTSQAVKGLLRDLNHHIPHLRDMARISYAQWMCSKNRCVSPGAREQAPLNDHFCETIPAAWEIAQHALPEGMRIVDTEMNAI